MLRSERITLNGKEYVRTYSDANKMIERDCVQYSEAIDPIGTERMYTETDIEAETRGDVY